MAKIALSWILCIALFICLLKEPVSWNQIRAAFRYVTAEKENKPKPQKQNPLTKSQQSNKTKNPTPPYCLLVCYEKGENERKLLQDTYSIWWDHILILFISVKVRTCTDFQCYYLIFFHFQALLNPYSILKRAWIWNKECFCMTWTIDS